LVVAPWILYAARHATDLAGQLTVYGQRGDFSRPTFYLENIAAEPQRYAHILAQPIPADVTGASALAYEASSWLLTVGIWPWLGVLVWRSLRRDVAARDDAARDDAARVGGSLLLLTLIVFGGLLLVVDQTKTPLYAVLLVPSLCAVLASAFVQMLRWAWR